MQKLVTIYLDNSAYGQGKWLKASYAEQHGLVEEHLEKYLSSGWRITDIHGFGGHGESLHARGWLIAVLAKE